MHPVRRHPLKAHRWQHWSEQGLGMKTRSSSTLFLGAVFLVVLCSLHAVVCAPNPPRLREIATTSRRSRLHQWEACSWAVDCVECADCTASSWERSAPRKPDSARPPSSFLWFHPMLRGCCRTASPDHNSCSLLSQVSFPGFPCKVPTESHFTWERESAPPRSC